MEDIKNRQKQAAISRRQARKSPDYVNNRELLEIIREYKARVLLCKQEGRSPPQVPPKAAKCFMMMATRYARKPSFAGYTYVDDMISDGVLACIRYFDNFDADKYENPFAYFTQLIHNAFINRLNIEQKHTYIKAKSLVQSPEYASMVVSTEFDVQPFNAVVDTYEAKLKIKKEKADLRKSKNDDTDNGLEDIE